MFAYKINSERSEPKKISVWRIKSHRSAVVSEGVFELLVRVIKHLIYTHKFLLQNLTTHFSYFLAYKL